MRRRYPLPHTWLLTDERQGDALWSALNRLQPGSGVIVRHYSLGERGRRKFFSCVRAVARRRRLVLLLSGTAAEARRWGADGFYSSPDGRRSPHLLWAATVHGRSELRRVTRHGADLALLSPLFPTRSHPGAPALGIAPFARMAKASRIPVIALGGIGPEHRWLLGRIGAYGWAGIDAFIKPNARRIRT